jgi:ABC-2 type transport system permease protein
MMRTPDLTIAWLTARQLLAMRRGYAVLALAALPVLLAAALRFRDVAEPMPVLLEIYTDFLVRIVLPVVALVFGTGAFGSEIDEGTAVYLLTKPVPRWRIAMAKLVTAAALTAAVVVGSTLITGIIAVGGAGPHRVVAAFTTAALLGSVLYCALFVALGLLLRRALMAGLIYVLVWEATAANTFAGTRTLSIRQYVLAAADRITTIDPDLFTALLPATTAFTMSIALLVAAALLTTHRLRNLELAEKA